MSVLEPLVFEPLLKPRAWGGDRLRRLGKAVPLGGHIGESWELADLPESIPEARTRIASGPWAGRTLREFMAERGAELLGLTGLTADGGFPLLVKFLDASEHLSVQVHPDAAYAAAHPHAHLKTEAWVVLEAEPGAVLYRGIRPEVTREQFFEHLTSPSPAGGRVAPVIDDLVAVPVERGDCVYLPSGICHALGAGIVVAEVQTPSDTTFRVFDWGRHDPNRPLHLEEARQCMRFGPEQEDNCPGVIRRNATSPIRTPGFATWRLCRTPHFSIEWIEASPGTKLHVITDSAPVVWMIVGGAADFTGPTGRALRTTVGETILIPARLEGWEARFPVSSTVVRTTLPSPLDRTLA